MAYADRIAFGEAFHTALRKGCDTNWSVGLWNGLHLIQKLEADMPKKDRPWTALCKWADEHRQEYPDKPIYDVALTWCQSDKNFRWSTELMLLKWLIEEADQETQDDVNATVKYWEEI